MESFLRKLVRLVTHDFFRIAAKQSWKWLRYYPAVILCDDVLQKWQESEWPEYQNWIAKNSLVSSEDEWEKQYGIAKQSGGNVKISIVTPVFNTDARILEECVLSVRTQTSPFWELILVDDGSTQPETLRVLQSRLCKDPRIRVLMPDSAFSSGISAATNRAIDRATGDYIVFLDHDDRLSPEAIQIIAQEIAADPGVDIIYSDRDMISTEGKRFMHLMKPDWSPENLYAGNYIFHLMCYRRSLVVKMGKLRSPFDGSQDYDLILRCMEVSPKVRHVSQVLYHWRQHAQSVALDDSSKDYAFEAGKAALRDALKRRKINAKVSENRSLWRGNYEIELPLPKVEQIGSIILPRDLPENEYVDAIFDSKMMKNPPDYIFIHQGDQKDCSGNSARVLASWLSLENIGMASGCTLNTDEKIVYAGMFHARRRVIAPYSGYDKGEVGYMAVTQTVRNISAPNPYSVMLKAELLQKFKGGNSEFRSAFALFDLALYSLLKQWRIVYVPRAVFRHSSHSLADICRRGDEREMFYEKWQSFLRHGDPYYNINLDGDSTNYELA